MLLQINSKLHIRSKNEDDICKSALKPFEFTLAKFPQTKMKEKVVFQDQTNLYKKMTKKRQEITDEDFDCSTKPFTLLMAEIQMLEVQKLKKEGKILRNDKSLKTMI